MAQAGAHAIIGMYSSRLPFINSSLVPFIIIGSLIPDLDIIFVAIGKLFSNLPDPIHYFHRKGTHSLLFVLFIYLTFQILSEIFKKPNLRNHGLGISLGILLHIIVDSLIFLEGVFILWPLQLKLNLWANYNPPPILPKLLMALEFLFFRILAWIIIEISTSKKDIRFPGLLPLLGKWKNTEFNLFLFFIGLSIFNIPFYDILFGIFYIPSLIISITIVWIMRDIFLENKIRDSI